MKVLVVSGQDALRQSLARALESLTEEIEVIIAAHEDALEQFLLEEPERVLICEYDEHGSGRDDYNRGLVTYRDIKNSATGDVIVIRSGLSSYDHPDYIKAPYMLTDLHEMLK